jgi:DNA-binding transcriptional ArsR family regulator
LVPSEIDLDVERPPDAVGIGDGDLFEALSSRTARRILSALRDGPRVTSRIAAETDRSIQVVSYHLEKLEAVGLVAVVGTTHSEKGREMDVYALTTDSIVVELSGAGPESEPGPGEAA